MKQGAVRGHVLFTVCLHINLVCRAFLPGLWFHELHNHVIKRINPAGTTVEVSVTAPASSPYCTPCACTCGWQVLMPT